jgi:hypothetical protein
MNTQQLTLDFARFVKEALGNHLAEVVIRNRAEPDKGVCHSHDFCDPNECMIDALAEQGETLHIVDDPADESGPVDLDQPYLAHAWDIATRCEFDAARIVNDEIFVFWDATGEDWRNAKVVRAKIAEVRTLCSDINHFIDEVSSPSLRLALRGEVADCG